MPQRPRSRSPAHGASKTLALGGEHVHPDDVTYATAVDRFDFAMEVERIDGGLRIRPTRV